MRYLRVPQVGERDYSCLNFDNKIDVLKLSPNLGDNLDAGILIENYTQILINALRNDPIEAIMK